MQTPGQPPRQNPQEIPTTHWADHAAEDLINKHPEKNRFVCASGISPSGMVHIGNFREVITVDFVVRALKERKKEVRFLYSWDDYDAFRKVPVNLPMQEMLKENLRKPLSEVPDPFGKAASYARHFESVFEDEIRQLGIQPEYIYQNIPYRQGKYINGILKAIQNEDCIRSILNKHRTEPLPEDWTAVSIFCRFCGKDTTTVTTYSPPSVFHYSCKACKRSDSIDLQKEGGLKLLWRVDWPMRWAEENVDFEPGGKDHSSQGGSYDTGAEIIRAVWKKEPPHYVQYDFVLAKGLGSKLSSSSGNLLTLSETLEIYEPAIIRWIFASRKPNLDFSIAFDLDVIKTYDDFDRSERFAFGTEQGEEKRVNYERRIYELSCVVPARIVGLAQAPAQFPFRHLCNILQIHQGDLSKTKAFYSQLIKTAADEERFLSRARRAWKWVTTYAPEDFRFVVRSEPGRRSEFPEAVRQLVTFLGTLKGTETDDAIATKIFEIMKQNAVEPKVFFQDIYLSLIGKKAGPKLASFFLAIGIPRSIEILSKSLD